jgi:hypothetical protein
MPKATIDQINAMLSEIKNILDDYSQYINTVTQEHNLLDEKVKINLLEYANKLTLENDENFPHFLTLERFITDVDYFTDFRKLVDLTSQIQEKLWNMTIKSADIARKGN